MEQEYEILPHKLLADLKYDVEALKKKLTQPDAKANELILEIESLKDSIHELTTIFQKSLEEIQGEGDVTKTMGDLNQRLDKVVSQNETIAKGMVAISDKLENFMRGNTTRQAVSAQTNQVQHTMGMPSMPGPGRVAPRPAVPAPSQPPTPSMPPMPPPPMRPKKQGIFK